MKYIVELKFTNPSHEHVSLRRRVESVTRIIEAKDENEAIRRVANQQRALGFMIQEAKIVTPEVKTPAPVITEAKKEDKTEVAMKDKSMASSDDSEEDGDTEIKKKNMKEGAVADMLASRREKAQKKIADMILKRDMEAAKQERADKRQAGTMKPVKEESEVQYIEEKLSASDPASKWISDFVASDNPKFAGKSKKERINMALGAYYAAKRGTNEEVEQVDEVNARHSLVATQQALTPKASNVKAATGTTARDKAVTNKYARRISKLTGGEYSKQDVKSNLKSLAKEEVEQIDEKYMGFKKLKAAIAAKGGARDPGAVAAAIGRKKYGKEKFQAAAAAGKKLGEAADPGKMRVVNKKVEVQASKDTKKSEKKAKATELAMKHAKGKKNPINVNPVLDNSKV